MTGPVTLDAAAVSGVSITVGGESVDLANVTWIKVTTCGCTVAATIGFSSYGGGAPHMVVTADHAWEQFGNARERKRDEERGFVVHAIRRGDLGSMTCEHDPKWGYEKAPRPDGMTWAAGGYYGDTTSTLHLVPSESVQSERDQQIPQALWRATSLCWTTKMHWSSEWHARDGKVECKRCIKVAAAIVAALTEAADQ